MNLDLSTRPRPRPHQRDALNALARAYSGAGRAQLRMACGTGKTLVGIWHAERSNARVVAIFEPSIALVAQTLTAWQAAASEPLRVLAVCSDPTTTTGRDELGDSGFDPYRGQHDQPGVTTRAPVLARFLDEAADAPERTVVVSTYHSADVLAQALRLTDHTRTLDLIIADEAHRLAGRTDPRFVPVLGEREIPARQRLFQTATPITLSGLGGMGQIHELTHTGRTRKAVSMDDATLFGPVAYTLPAGAAIADGLLADYRVVVAQPANGHDHVPERAALAALVDTARQYGIRRVLTFHNRVSSARQFAARLNGLGELDGVPVQAHAVDGTMPDAQRRNALRALANTDGDHRITVVCSAQCLREGVDVPAVDAVLFADPRSSNVAIIQAVGRVLRTHPGKTTGTVVIPLVLDAARDDQEQLADSAYAHVWRVLRGLRAHDERVAQDLDRARATTGSNPDGTGQEVPWLTVIGDEPGAVLTRLLERASPMWESYYGLLKAAVARRGTAAAITATTTEQGRPLGHWVAVQRMQYRRRDLDPDRARRLSEIHGWHWSAAAAIDHRSLAVLRDLARRTGTVAENPTAPSAYANLCAGDRRPLGFWVASQIAKRHDGELDPDLEQSLAELPGWSWHPHDQTDEAMLDALRRFITWEGHTDVPPNHVEDELALGAWLRNLRRRRLKAGLPPALEAAVLTAAPIHTGSGARAFAWNPSQTAWDLGMDAAHSYISRIGSLAHVPVGHEEDVDGHTVRLYQWIARARFLYHRDRLEPDRVHAVEVLPGWTWRARHTGTRAVQIGEAIDLGDVPHGRRGYRLGCPCSTCVGDNRACTAEAARQSHLRHRANWVDAEEVSDHLRGLVAADPHRHQDPSTYVVTVGAIAAAAGGLSTGLIRGLLNGSLDSCHPLHREVLLTLTINDIRAVRTIRGSRKGRMGIAAGEPVDPRPTWAIVDELHEAGWTHAAISAALGYRRSNGSLPFTREAVTAPQANLVRLLRDWLGADFTPPTRTSAPRPVRRLSGAAGAAADQEAIDLLEQGYAIPHTAKHTGLSIAAVTALDRRINAA
jgi:superfamily II DNA or RNA helicase